jgi:fibro-slime domain-containing protein
MQTCAHNQWTECDVTTTRSCSNDCGTGTQTCFDGVWSVCDAYAIRECDSACGPGSQACSLGTWGPCRGPESGPPVLEVTIRDFLDTHPDFERSVGGWGSPGEQGIVAAELGPDDKPVYAGDPATGTATTTGQPFFDQWYGRAPGEYVATTHEIELARSPIGSGMFRYSDTAFFPIDGQLLGNQERTHNFHFTLELSTRFRYEGGEVFSFRGDDDLWVFIHRQLALDLGGLHEEQQGSVELDAHAAAWGLQVGEVYPLHLFFAERHTIDSHFTIETTIAEWHTCG